MDLLEKNLENLCTLVAKEEERPGVWNYSPMEISREQSAFVGLLNLGATCYMNSILQQFFMIPGFRRDILNVDMQSSQESSDGDCLMHQLQVLFAHLQESRKRFYDPTPFTLAYKDSDGNLMDPGIQMDVDEFFNLLFDRLENVIEKSPHQDLFKNHFEGKLAQQIKSKSCKHISEREESFFALQIEVKDIPDIATSLKKYVEGEVLDGDNQYQCSECSAKVDAVKRMCIKKLPKHLLMHLKRFEFDFQAMRRLKINDLFSFPHELDMEPYTDAYISRAESTGNNSPMDMEQPDTGYKYRLGGVLVHQGTADSGHYYSFIKKREGAGDEWLQFNDAVVSSFSVDDLPAMAFGGIRSPGNSNPNLRRGNKNYSAYMLVYDRIEADIESQVLEISLPKKLGKLVSESNERFSRDLRVYGPDMVNLVLSTVRISCISDSMSQQIHHDNAFKLLAVYFTKVYIRTKELSGISDWSSLLLSALNADVSLAQWFLHYLTASESVIKEALLSCPITVVRQVFAELLLTCVKEVRGLKDSSSAGDIEKLIDILKSFLETIRCYWRTFDQFWGFLADIAALGKDECKLVLDSGAFVAALEVMMVNDSFTSEKVQFFIGTRTVRVDVDNVVKFIYSVIVQIDIFASYLSWKNKNVHFAHDKLVLRGVEFEMLFFGHQSNDLIVLRKMCTFGASAAETPLFVEYLMSELITNLNDLVPMAATTALTSGSAAAASAVFEAFKSMMSKNTESEIVVDPADAVKFLLGLFNRRDFSANAFEVTLKYFCDWSRTFPQVRDTLELHFADWAFFSLIHSKQEIRLEAEHLVKDLILEPMISIMQISSPLQQRNIGKVIVVENSARVEEGTSRIFKIFRYLFEMLGHVRRELRDVADNEDLPIGSYASVLDTCFGAVRDFKLNSQYLGDVIGILADSNSRAHSFDLGVLNMTIFLNHVIDRNPKIIGELAHVAIYRSFLLKYFQTVKDEEIYVKYNYQAFSVYHRLLLETCKVSRPFIKELVRSSPFRWAISNVALNRQYQKITDNIFAVITMCAEVSYDFRMSWMQLALQKIKDAQYHLQHIRLLNATTLFASQLELLDRVDLFKVLEKELGSLRTHMKVNSSYPFSVLEMWRKVVYHFSSSTAAGMPTRISTRLLARNNLDHFLDVLFRFLDWNTPEPYISMICGILSNLMKIPEVMTMVDSAYLQDEISAGLEVFDQSLSFSADFEVPAAALRPWSPYISYNIVSPPPANSHIPMTMECGIFVLKPLIMRIHKDDRPRVAATYFQPYNNLLTIISHSMWTNRQSKILAIRISFYLSLCSTVVEVMMADQLLWMIINAPDFIETLRRHKLETTYQTFVMHIVTQLFDAEALKSPLLIYTLERLFDIGKRLSPEIGEKMVASFYAWLSGVSSPELLRIWLPLVQAAELSHEPSIDLARLQNVAAHSEFLQMKPDYRASLENIDIETLLTLPVIVGGIESPDTPPPYEFGQEREEADELGETVEASDAEETIDLPLSDDDDQIL